MAGPSDRRDARVPLAARVQIKTEGLDKFIQKFSGDISRGGMFIKTPTPLPIGKEVHLTVVAPGGTHLIEAKGTVSWIREKTDPKTGEPPGMGIQFAELMDGSAEVLDKIVSIVGDRSAKKDTQPSKAAEPAAAPKAAPPVTAKPATPAPAPVPPAGPSLAFDPEFTPVDIPMDLFDDPAPVVAPPKAAPPKPEPPKPEPPKPEPPKPAPTAKPPVPVAASVPPMGGTPVRVEPPRAAPAALAQMGAKGISSILGDIEELLADQPGGEGAAPASPSVATPAAAPAKPAPVAPPVVQRPPPIPTTPTPMVPTIARAPVPAPDDFIQPDIDVPSTDTTPGTVPETDARDIVLGIDLGTTFSCAAFARDGVIEVVPVDSGNRTLPSVVTITQQDQLVGRAAYDRIATHPKNTIYGSKRLLGRKFISRAVQDARRYFDYEIVGDENGNAAVRIDGEIFPLVLVTSKILEEIRKWAESYFHRPVRDAVICVPAYYNDNQRGAVIEAGRSAGFEVRRIVNEPVAAALAYGCDKGFNQKLLVYDLGGGTFDVSVMELNANVFDVIAAGGDPYLGGVDFDNRIVEYLIAEFRRTSGVDVQSDKVAVLRLRAAAEAAKRELSEKHEAQITLPYLARVNGAAANLEIVLKRTSLEALVSDLVDRTVHICGEVLEAAGLDKAEIDDVLLVGGQTRMPMVQTALEAFFKKPPRKGVHPDEAVAMGAALLASSMERVDSVVLLDVVSMSIGVGLPGGIYQPVLLRNSKLPATAATVLATTRGDQTSMSIDVFQGDFTELSRNDYLGTIELDGFAALPAGQIRFQIVFRMDAQGFLVVTATELSSGISQQVTFRTRESPEALEAALN